MIQTFILGALLALSPTLARAEVSWYPLPEEAYQFEKLYPEAQRLLYAFDYGHAFLYESLLENKGLIANPKAFESQLLKRIIEVLNSPPHVKVDETDIAPGYVFQFPLAIDLFDWSHLLHQFIYDVLATATDRGDALDKRVLQIFSKYQSQPRIAITDQCKSMQFMDNQKTEEGLFYSKAFRRTYPRLNLLIWSYHWFQIRLYEALLEPTRAQRDVEVAATVTKFREMISNLPQSAIDLDMMPGTYLVAPSFAQRFSNIANAFDNVHMFHDVVSDILVSDKTTSDLNKIKKTGLRVSRMALDPAAFKTTQCGIW